VIEGHPDLRIARPAPARSPVLELSSKNSVE
jgi:hypothetical protein